MSNHPALYELLSLVSEGENILWQGRPNKRCFILESIFNPLLPIALIWGAIDCGFMYAAMSGNMQTNQVTAPMGLVTDQGVYTSGGIFTQNLERKPFSEMSNVNLHRGIFDQMLGVGDVVMTSNHDGYNSRHNLYRGTTICDIADYAQVYQLVKKLQTDIFADTMYPNDLRPKENHGYKTQYKPNDDLNS